MWTLLLGCLPIQSEGPTGTSFEGPWRWVGLNDSQICAINTNRKMACVRPRSGAPEWISHWDDYLTLDGGAGGICALTEDGAIDCSMTTISPLQDSRPSSTAWDKVRVGNGAACVLRENGDLRCWGDDEGERLSQIPEDQLFADASIEANFGAGVTLEGNVWSWGNGRPRATGEMLYTAPLNSLDVATNLIVVASENEAFSIDHRINDLPERGVVQAAESSFCFLDEEGAITCRGSLRSPTSTQSFRDFDVSEEYGCGVHASGQQRIECWGDARTYPFEAGSEWDDFWGTGSDSDTAW